MEFLPPQNLEAEQGVLGAILLDSRVLPDVLEVLSEGDFYKGWNRVIFAAMRSLSTAGSAVDVLTVSAELAKGTEPWGGKAYLAELCRVPVSVNAVYHAKLVKDAAIRRQISHLCLDVLGRVDKDEPGELLSMLTSAAIDDGQSKIVPISVVMQELDRRNQKGYKKPPVIETDFVNLDMIVGGFEPGELIVIGGRPSMGKTAIAGNWASHISQSTDTHIIEIEMSNIALGARLVASECGIPAKAITRGDVKNYEPFHAAILDLNRRKLTFDDQAVKLSQVESSYLKAVREARRRQKEAGAKKDEPVVVFLDHLQNTSNQMAGRNRNDEVAHITGTIKMLAKRTGTVAVALSQLRRPEAGMKVQRPTLRDLRESGAIEQDADVVIFVHRPGHPEYNQGVAVNDDIIELIVAKNRNGTMGIVTMGWDGKRTKAVERS